jgi:hypothetical protein
VLLNGLTRRRQHRLRVRRPRARRERLHPLKRARPLRNLLRMPMLSNLRKFRAKRRLRDKERRLKRRPKSPRRFRQSSSRILAHRELPIALRLQRSPHNIRIPIRVFNPRLKRLNKGSKKPLLSLRKRLTGSYQSLRQSRRGSKRQQRLTPERYPLRSMI